jgi:membrane protein required for colicin V production
LTLFDLVALGLLAISALLGFVRGAVRELVTVFAFTLAAWICVALLLISGPIARRSIHPGWAANASALIVVFLIAYVALRVLGGWLSTVLKSQATLGTLDRSLGLGFGVVRALVVLGVFYIVFNAATPSYLVPSWIADGALYPVSRASAEALQAVAPKGLHAAGGLGQVLKDGIAKEPGDDPAEPDAPGAATASSAPDRDKASPPNTPAEGAKTERKRLHVVVGPYR